MKIAILGSGFIARFYADSLNAQRRKDTLHSVYSRSTERAEKFAKDYDLPHYSNIMSEVKSSGSSGSLEAEGELKKSGNVKGFLSLEANLGRGCIKRSISAGRTPVALASAVLPR